MKTVEFSHKDIFIKVHVSLMVYEQQADGGELVFAVVIDIDSRVQALFAQFHHAKREDASFRLRHARAIGEQKKDEPGIRITSKGSYKHLSHREDDTFVTGIITKEQTMERIGDEYIVMVWDGELHEKVFWSIEQHYETPMLPEWIPYVLDQLSEQDKLKQLHVEDSDQDYPLLQAYKLTASEDDLDTIISMGLSSGAIHI
ncbi:hypothetical protein ACE41H_15730 [Paenibacillus enshidis]|uniref:Uncharacterized protein n=1 Tax=Paenibacillus enshidis TaxID=1458439 RepID=A0ABV5AVI3_9BACL